MCGRCQCLRVCRPAGYPFRGASFGYGVGGRQTPGKLGTGSFPVSNYKSSREGGGRLSSVGSGQAALGRVSQVPVEDDRLAGRFRVRPGVTDGTFLFLLVWKDQSCLRFDLWPQLYHRGAQTIMG